MSGEQVKKLVNSLRWLPAYGWQQLARRPARNGRPSHLIIALADHFEPVAGSRGPLKNRVRLDVQQGLVERWCREYPRAFGAWRDAEGFPFRHTYFYPVDEYQRAEIELLAEHCHDGWGEIEIQFHHGVCTPDTEEGTRRALIRFRDDLAREGCLSRWGGQGPPRYAFVHGNWALANSAGGSNCGVDAEMKILAETGCYADFTLPSAPDPSQVAKINALYECALPLGSRAPHRRGRDLRTGWPPRTFPLIVGGPLGLNFARRGIGAPIPYIENGALTAKNPPTMHRLQLWRRAAVAVRGRPDWLFIKLHCHGMESRDYETILGGPMQTFLRELTQEARANSYQLHFVTAREMVNVILAACDGREGSPGGYRDYRLQLIKPSKTA